jgi:pyruvate,orthophosphate dikinase
MGVNGELRVLRVVRLKGRVEPDAVSEASGLPLEAMGSILDGLVGAGALSEANGRYRLTPEGRERLSTLLEQERAGLDAGAIASLYAEFDAPNSELKELANAWQMREGEPNDHTDAGYDHEILDRLAGVHERTLELLRRIIAVAPRLEPYPQRLTKALGQIQAGDHGWFLRPVVDSYHTIWFELHEDLIGLAGQTREAEAAAGRAE